MNVLFFGTPDFSVPTLQSLIDLPNVSVGAVVTQPDRPSGRGSKVTMSPVKQLALQHSIPVLQPLSLKKELATISSEISRLGPFDIGVVIAFGQILPRDVLQIPTRGCINVHASLLPRWRGAAPIQRAIEAGDTETGVCIMQMDEGLDTGAVFIERRMPILSKDTGGSLHDTLATLGASCIGDCLEQIVSGHLHATPQPKEGITYASKISSVECEINWNLPAHHIALRVRAFSPSPGCFTRWRGKRIKILFAADSGRTYPQPVAPGTIVHAQSDRFEISCGAGSSLLISDVQLEGKKRMPVEEFLRGTSLSQGELIGG